MDWFSLDTRRQRSFEYMRIPFDVRGFHLAVLALLAEREQGSTLVGARDWTGRDWSLACAGTLGLVAKLVAAGLGRWDGKNLCVSDYDEGGEERVRKARDSGANSWKSRRSKVSDPQSGPDSAPVTDLPREPHTRNGTERNGTEQEGAECRAEPDAPLLSIFEPRPAKPAKAPDPARVETASWLEWFNRRFGRSFRVTEELVRMVKALNARGYHEKPDMRGVAWFLRDEWLEDAKMAKFLKPDSILVASKFGIRLDEAKERYPQFWEERAADDEREEDRNAAG